MRRLVEKYEQKLLAAKLADPDNPPLLAGLDHELVWNREDAATAPLRAELEQLFAALSINSLVFLRPAEPYATIMDLLAREALADNPDAARITPEDCETRTFLHDLPVRPHADAASLAEALGSRKCCIVPGQGIAAHGTVSPEQGFVTVSSACFACFVLFFSRSLRDLRSGNVRPGWDAAFSRVAALLPPPRTGHPTLRPGPFADRESALAAMCEAGRATVEYGLVDSYFGNVSCLLPEERGGLLLISQTGSSLEELEGHIDPCPLDGSSTACLTASSELSAHQRSYATDPEIRTLLHGHPRFAVILSMDCARRNAAQNNAGDCAVFRAGQCHSRCPEIRTLDAEGATGVRIVPGEVGTGPTGLCNTLPPALAGRGGAVVHGHGVFTTGKADFREAFSRLLEIENACRREYFRKIKAARACTAAPATSEEKI
ncbi:MAG: class II aldolase/adducin family protein [Desulfovibrio sp.]